MMKPQSAKAKGRRLQQWLRSLLLRELKISPADVESRSMGAPGEDLMLSQAARELWPYSVECKNTESLNVWAAWKQACANAGEHEPLLIIKRNRAPPLAVVDALHFVKLSTGENDEKHDDS